MECKAIIILGVNRRYQG